MNALSHSITLRFFVPLLVILAAVTRVDAIDFTWEGENYRDVKVIEVKADQVTLESRKKEKIVVPMDRLSGLLAADAKAFAEKQKNAKPEEKAVKAFGPDRKTNVQDTWERAWIFGITSDPSAEGFLVFSSANSLPRGRPGRDGLPGKVKTSKGGAEIYRGRVFVKGLRAKENIEFNKVLYRDGYVTHGAARVPAFSVSKPVINLPVMTSKERDWTNSDGRKMRAKLLKIVDGKGHFISSKGKSFTYPLNNLMADDQVFATEAYEKYRKEVEQIKKDYPWLKLK